MSENVKILAQELGAVFKVANVNGQPGFILFDHSYGVTEPRTWLWYAPTFADRWPNLVNAWMFRQFLAAGMTVAGIDVGESYGNPQGRRIFCEFYALLTEEYGLSEKACLMPQSRGGLMLYNWAAEHPEHVACIAGIFPVCDLSSYPGIAVAAPAYDMSGPELSQHLAEHNPVDRLEPLAKAKVPIFHVHGDEDTGVPLEPNSGEMARRYELLGGPMQLVVIPGRGHDESDQFFKCQRLVDFGLQHRSNVKS